MFVHIYTDRIGSCISKKGFQSNHIQQITLIGAFEVVQAPDQDFCLWRFRHIQLGGKIQGRSRNCWRDYRSNPAWEHLRIPKDEQKDVAAEKDICGALLCFQTDPDKRLKMDVWLDNGGICRVVHKKGTYYIRVDSNLFK